MFLCTYRLNWARKTSWRWWNNRVGTAIQTQDLKFELWWSEAELAISRSRRLPTILNLCEWAEKKHFNTYKLEGQSGARTRDLRFSNRQFLTTAPGPRLSNCNKTKDHHSSFDLVWPIGPVSHTSGFKTKLDQRIKITDFTPPYVILVQR